MALLVGATQSDARELRVFAAASLTDAFAEVEKRFEADHPGVDVSLSFAGSQVLKVQIEQGADADVFASADRAQTNALETAKLLEHASSFARNQLVVVTLAEDKKVRDLIDLARPGMKLVVAGPTVPVGRYTQQLLGKMASSGLYGDDYRTRVQANVVSQESNVRAVLAKVALGEADAGIVYRTDAMTALGKVQMLDIPERLNVVAEYPIGIVSSSKEADLAKQFVELVLSDDGQAILSRFSFLH